MNSSIVTHIYMYTEMYCPHIPLLEAVRSLYTAPREQEVKSYLPKYRSIVNIEFSPGHTVISFTLTVNLGIYHKLPTV